MLGSRRTSTDRPRRPSWWWGAIVGLLGAGVLLGVAEAVALLVDRSRSPLIAVGGFVIDIVPRPIKEFAIETFGALDKIVLLASLGVGAAIAAALAGVIARRSPYLGAGLLALGGAAAIAATVTRAGATWVSALPGLLGTAAGVAILLLLIARLRRWDAVTADPDAETPAGLERRSFLRFTAIAGASAVLLGIGGRAINAATSSIAAIREAVRLPAPGSRVTVPAGAELDIPGLSPLYTPNADFYRVDTALVVPSIDPAQWRLTIDGRVGQPIELGFDDLLARGLDEYSITLTCVSNFVGGDLVGSAKWLGVPVRDLLALAQPESGADMVLSESVDGYTASTPLDALTDPNRDAILAVAMNGEPLPLEHGFPVRMVVPGLYGYVSATKWLTRLTVTTFAEDEAYWTPRGYSAEAPIKFSSRVDTPRTGEPVPAGPGVVAGVAWAQSVGISAVEVQIDDGDWQQAMLSTPVNRDTWVQWALPWEPEPGIHYIAVRAIDATGAVQVEERAPIAPDGSTGWQRVLVTVT
jgi:DMSO/TMAO reductase YedYZ molybdopterin-dependent catalytic subunit